MNIFKNVQYWIGQKISINLISYHFLLMIKINEFAGYLTRSSLLVTKLKSLLSINSKITIEANDSFIENIADPNKHE